jgi:hypothetical protein
MRRPIVALVLATAIGAAILQADALDAGVRYDGADKDHAWLAAALAGIRTGYAAGGRIASLDLARLNGGRWTFACISGGYTDPVELMASRGAQVSAADQARFAPPRLGRRMAAVEEFELVVSYADTSNTAHFVHLQHGIGAGGQHRQACISAPQTELQLATDE